MSKKYPESRYNEAMCALWRSTVEESQWPEQLDRLWPMQYPVLRKGAAVIVGMNPSHDKGNVKDEELLAFNGKGQPKFDSATVREDILERERESVKTHPYFGKFDELLHHDRWSHVDLFAVRHTTQADVVKALKLDAQKSLKLRFALKQLEASLSLVDALTPRMVLVVNGFASRLLRYRFGFIEASAAEDGVHRRNGIPWFFSGMITGQRALDQSSCERLQWHINLVTK